MVPNTAAECTLTMPHLSSNGVVSETMMLLTMEEDVLYVIPI